MDASFIKKFSSPLALVLVLAGIVRFGFLYKNWNNLDFAPSFLLHAEVARNILNGHWFQEDRAYLRQYTDSCMSRQTLIDPEDFPPPTHEQLVPLYNDEGGYGMMLAGLWKIAGAKRWWYIRVIQVLLDIVMCWLLYRIGKTLFEERVGILCAFLYACFVPGIELTVRPHRDIWVTFLFIFTTYQLVQLRQDRNVLWRLLWIGVATGVVAWMRSTVLLFVILLVPGLFVIVGRKQVARSSAVLLAGFLLTFSPLIVRNYVVFDKFMATRGAFWHSFWAGVGQTPNPFNLRDDDETVVRFAQSIDSTAQLDTDHYEQVLKQKALTFIREHPFWYIGSALKRAAVFVFPKIGRELFFQPQLPQYVTGALNTSVAKAVLLAVDAIVSGLFLAGIWLTRSRWKELLIAGYAYLYTLITLAPFYLAGRNIMNVYFFVLLLVSVTVVAIWKRFSPKVSSVLDQPRSAA